MRHTRIVNQFGQPKWSMEFCCMFPLLRLFWERDSLQSNQVSKEVFMRREVFLALFSALVVATAAIGWVVDARGDQGVPCPCRYNVDMVKMDCGDNSGTCCKCPANGS
jgi:hypothetical protein